MIRPLRFAVAALAVFAACSSESTAPLETQNDAALAAQTFSNLADSVSRSGGDPDVGNGYSAIADAVRLGGRVSSIVIAVDGVPTTFLATASAVTIDLCAKSTCDAVRIVYRSLIAWDKANPRRVVQLTSASDVHPIGAMLYPSLLAIYEPMASLIYMDGTGGTYFGTSGSQQFSFAVSPTSCTSTRDSAMAPTRGPLACSQADFKIAFSAKAEPSAFLVSKNNATGTRALSMSSQTVVGSHSLIDARRCDAACKPGEPGGMPPGPPIVVRPSSDLPGSVSASVDSVVTLTLTVKNPSAQSIKVKFPGGQRYDFVVTDSATRKEVWRWGAGQAFTKEIGEQDVAAGGALVYRERWKPSTRGKLFIRAVLVSLTHRSEAYTTVVVP